MSKQEEHEIQLWAIEARRIMAQNKRDERRRRKLQAIEDDKESREPATRVLPARV